MWRSCDVSDRRKNIHFSFYLFMNLQTEIIAVRQSTQQQIRLNRPVRTSKSYDPRAQTYRVWCGIKAQLERFESLNDLWIDEDRLLMFLNDVVIGKPTFPRGRPGPNTLTTAEVIKRNMEFNLGINAVVLMNQVRILSSGNAIQDDDDDFEFTSDLQHAISNSTSPIIEHTVNSFKTALQWVTALVDYHKHLSMLTPNHNFSHPRGPLVKGLLKVYKKILIQIKRYGLNGVGMAGRGAHTIADGGDEVTIAEASLRLWQDVGGRVYTEKSLRTRAEALVSYGMMCRSETPRHQMLDYFTAPMKDRMELISFELLTTNQRLINSVT